ncbi:MAG: sigma-70 family RNA polymerase sigma factor [Microbacterium sp.]|uniref:sigma-70 family RNA polymerase sigma factor n=1 Tax=Microbacterium sp. TaxID=51671 RepID=UPI001DC89C13|nr:sigma-70 family RNA polymerase sigma factor [Microbacterium sp.]MBW8762037.1 sigma-70 family RNA polymerase sigma factor [Microbacterium sp.]
MDEPRDAPESDNALLLRSRSGDRHAFSELWRRHSPVAVAYARSLGASPPDPEDVVSDAFLSILRQLRSGKGPQRSFRPYLLTTVKNTWMGHARRAPITMPLDDAEHPPSLIGSIDVEAMVNSAAVVEAFGSLPERWQHALWLSEVEQLPPREIAEVLHIRPNSAAALTYRARDALRKAWIRAHLRTAPIGSEHARVIELLGAYAHDDLAPRSERFVTAHIDECETCRSAAGEARHLARAMSLGPLLAGGTGLVLLPALFPTEQAAAAATGLAGWAGLPAHVQPALDAAGNTAPVLWPVAAATAVALSISGSLFVRPVAEPDATAALAPAASAPARPAPAVPSSAPAPAVTAPAPVAAAPDPVPVAPPATTNPTPVAPVVEEPVEDAVDKTVTILTKTDRGRDHDDDEDPGGDEGNAFGHDKKGDVTAEDVGDMMSARGSSWWTTAVIVYVTADDESISVAVWGADETEVALVIDDQTIGTASDEAVDFDLALPEGEHTLEAYYVDDEGAVGDLAAETVVTTGTAPSREDGSTSK